MPRLCKTIERPEFVWVEALDFFGRFHPLTDENGKKVMIDLYRDVSSATEAKALIDRQLQSVALMEQLWGMHDAGT